MTTNSLSAKDRLALLETQVLSLTANVETFANMINEYKAVQDTHQDKVDDLISWRELQRAWGKDLIEKWILLENRLIALERRKWWQFWK